MQILMHRHKEEEEEKTGCFRVYKWWCAVTLFILKKKEKNKNNWRQRPVQELEVKN